MPTAIGIGIGTCFGGQGFDGGGSPPPFDPLDLSPAGWYKADVGLFQERTGAAATTPALLLSDPVGTWQDQSGNNRHLTAATDAARGSVQLGLQNGLPGVRFDGTDDALLNAALGALLAGSDVPHSIFYVSRSNTPAQTLQTEVLLTTVDGNAAFQAVYNASTTTGMTLARRDDAFNQVNATFTDDRSGFRILEWVFAGTTVTIRRNGTALLTAAAMDVGAATWDRLVVGGGSPSSFFLGDILEVLVLPTALSDGDATLLREHLGTRYGITVV